MDDYISRQAAIDAVRCLQTYKLFEGDDMLLVDVAEVLTDLMMLPSTQQQDIARDIATIIENEKDMRVVLKQPRWIPCSARLPEEFYVLCCDNHGEMLIANPFKCDDSDTGFSAESEDCYMYNCIAWMPLPEPYKGEES